MPGDCGAWVVNASTGLVYGHIVAGDPVTGMAFIIPAHKVFSDIEHRFGIRPALLTEEPWAQLAAARSRRKQFALETLQLALETQLASRVQLTSIELAELSEALYCLGLIVAVLRLDRLIAALDTRISRRFGRGQYMLFMDHVSPIPTLLKLISR